jgi:hypothetical protein
MRFRQIPPIAAALVLCVAASTQALAGWFAEILSRGVVRVSVFADVPPFGM